MGNANAYKYELETKELTPSYQFPNPSWMILIGLFQIAAGFAAIALPLLSTLTVELILAVALIVSGFLQLYETLAYKAKRNLINGVSSVLYVVLGLLFLMFPTFTIHGLTLTLGAFLVIVGLLKLFSGLATTVRRGMLIANGIGALALGSIILIFFTELAMVALGVIVGVELLFTGFTTVSMGTYLKSSD